ncbi:BTB/POZ and MATH domain-containing protein 2-like [Lolium rigidum]|uniref:BTB/POZ and MATH domain-containing protein 2-like n=1 Tax=Lolium rigidum TaxID=89674 RepID=UPI001F5D915C|nr:BTB/POZ and MATH domain-containing protein 2-like [Lolium rigidum]
MDLWRRLTNKGSSVPRQSDTSSRCVTESVSGTHDFVVANYSRIRDLPEGDSVMSGTFTVGGCDWFLCFYPRGAFWSTAFHTEEYRGYVAASVHLLKKETPVMATARVTIGLMDRHGEMKNITTSDTYNFTPGVSLKFHDFTRKSKLASRRYLKDDCVTIRCVLTVLTPRTEATRAVPATAAPLPELNGHLERMLRDGKGTDVTIEIGGQAFRAHSCVLAARSPVFDAELFGPMKRKDTDERIRIEDMEPTVFESLLHFIYTDSLPGNGEGCSTAVTQHLLVAADRYGVEKLKHACDMKLRATLDVETVATTMVLAKQHHCPLLTDACITFMVSSRKVLADVAATEGFKHFTASIPLENQIEILGKVSH